MFLYASMKFELVTYKLILKRGESEKWLKPVIIKWVVMSRSLILMFVIYMWSSSSFFDFFVLFLFDCDTSG